MISGNAKSDSVSLGGTWDCTLLTSSQWYRCNWTVVHTPSSKGIDHVRHWLTGQDRKVSDKQEPNRARGVLEKTWQEPAGTWTSNPGWGNSAMQTHVMQHVSSLKRTHTPNPHCLVCKMAFMSREGWGLLGHLSCHLEREAVNGVSPADFLQLTGNR